MARLIDRPFSLEEVVKGAGSDGDGELAVPMHPTMKECKGQSCGLGLECPPKAHMLKAWSPAPGVIRRW